ncbi:fungal-specific transcription factor domain-containing protein, partial [Dichotomocladium elegans]
PTGKANWTLSLTPNGLRIDTNIISLNDLYGILLNGLSQLQIPRRPKTIRRTSSASVASAEDAVIVKHNPLYKSKDVIFPLYSAWESNSSSPPTQARWDVKRNATIAIDAELLDQLLHIYEECFLCLPLPDMDTFIRRCKTQTGSPLLLNAMLAWSARHAAIYHRGTFPSEQDPNRVGEPYFRVAKTLLKDQFLRPTLDTVHALLLMYIYSIGKTGHDRDESEAYTFLGLATRMSVDMGLYREPYEGNDEAEKELKRRLFAAAEFLETLCASHSEKPLMFPLDEAITVRPPRVLDTETNLERRYRTEFTVYRHKINQIYRKIHTSVSGKTDPYLATVSDLEKQLKEWYASLPEYFKILPPQRKTRSWASTSFREQACLKLNFEYHFQMCQLYSVFLPPHPDETHHQATTSAISFLSLRLCVENADAITDLLKCWAQLRQPWCHFTLDTLVMACLVYSHQLLSAKEDVLAHAKRQMLRIAHTLSRSPVKHHKYVKTLVSRIEHQIKGDQVEEAAAVALSPGGQHANVPTTSALEEHP